MKVAILMFLLAAADLISADKLHDLADDFEKIEEDLKLMKDELNPSEKGEKKKDNIPVADSPKVKAEDIHEEKKDDHAKDNDAAAEVTKIKEDKEKDSDDDDDYEEEDENGKEKYAKGEIKDGEEMMDEDCSSRPANEVMRRRNDATYRRRTTCYTCDEGICRRRRSGRRRRWLGK